MLMNEWNPVVRGGAIVQPVNQTQRTRIWHENEPAGVDFN